MTKNKYDFSGKTVLITGGGSGMGRAMARAFLDNGANVAVTGRREAPLLETLSPYPADRTLAISGDISTPDTAKDAVAATIEKFGALHVAVHNAAIFTGGEIQDVSDEAWDRIRAINIDGFFHFAKTVYPALVKTKGSFIATLSVSALYGDWAQSVYNATKHAEAGFVRCMALDWGKQGIRVNGIAPAFTLTDMTAGMLPTEEPARTEALAPFVNRIALGRPGLPEDIAPAVLFLASEDAAYITGAILPVDGGTSVSTGQPHIE